jgi:5-methylcytosine-specific restriction endonuclease McrA
MPQVELLLGRRSKKGVLSISHQGYLRRLFARLIAEGKLPPEQTAPDYCIIETLRDAPRTEAERKQIEEAQKERRDMREKQFAEQQIPADAGVASRRRRLQLHAQQGGVCPYTGDPLGDALSPELEIDHLFPQALGGLTMEDNLVLTHRSTNGEKQRRTPMQWKGRDWMHAEGRRLTQPMRWSARKRQIFAWGMEPEQEGIPDFGNTTRTAQLARQLYAEMAEWMGISAISDDKERERERARRIGTPSGWLSAQARRAWLTGGAARVAADYAKDRGNLVHHLIDAAVLSYVPPGLGLNHARCGGIFYNQAETVGQTMRWRTTALPLLQLEGHPLLAWLRDDRQYAACPVEIIRGAGRTKTLGDSSFWRQPDPTKPALAQRTPLDLDRLKKVGDAQALESVLLKMGIPQKKLPSQKQIKDWMVSATAATREEGKTSPPLLRLKDGTPVKSIWKWDEKGQLGGYIGWSARQDADGSLKDFRRLTTTNDRLEVWLGYDVEEAKAARRKGKADWEQAGWTYFSRLMPDATAVRHLQQMGFDLDSAAPVWLQDSPEEKKTLRECLYGDKLPPFSKKMGAFRRGDVHRIFRDRSGECCLPEQAYWSDHMKVTAIKKQLVFKSALFTDKDSTRLVNPEFNPLEYKPSSPQVLAAVLGKPSAATQAQAMINQGKLRIPTLPDDPPLSAARRPRRAPSDSRQTEMRLE